MIDRAKIEGHTLGNLGAPLAQFDRCVCVVHYEPQFFAQRGPAPVNPNVLHQVTLMAANLSPSGKLIRFGATPGDELMGWQFVDALYVEEVLGVLEDDGKTVSVEQRIPSKDEFMSALQKREAA